MADAQMPHLRRQGSATQLIVDGEPFLVLGGELHNSSSSSLEYMQPIWQRMLDLNFNTVLAPVSWELIEPQEGQFDFALVDGLLQEARRHGLRLIVLWFGSWKNGMSSYIPLWVKQDYARFARARIGGETAEVLSTLAEANWQADARAFAALMRHLAEVDGQDHTVIMVQVENEVGVLGDSRDRCEAADRAYGGAVPQELIAYLREHQSDLVPELGQRWQAAGLVAGGSWEALFGAGPATDEIFMAWHYARYVDQVAAAGKAEYDLPMFVNAWLSSSALKPGDWPSGGPLPHVMDIWLAGAGRIDMLTPDIYQPNFEAWCTKFTQRGNPLFIPEMRWGEDGARNIFYAIGQHDAIGTSPFAVDSIGQPALGAWLSPAEAIVQPAQAPLSKSYAALQQIAPLILEHQGLGELAGFLLDAEHPSVERRLGEYDLEISLDAVFGYRADVGYGLLIAVGPNEFVGAGSGFRVAFRPTTAGPARVGIAAVDEGAYRDGAWVARRRLNGDENDQGRGWRFSNQGISIERCTVYRFE
jgi:beta-galactosidase GanA